MALKISLEKLEAEAPELVPAAKAFSICLEKAENETNADRRLEPGHQAEVVVMTDESSSTEDRQRLFYTNGHFQRLVEALVPLGLQFDDNGRIDLGFFSARARMVGDVGIDDFRGCVERLQPRAWGGTNYADAIRVVKQLYIERHGVEKKSGGFMSRHTTKVVEGPQAMPMVVFVPTDGEPNRGTEPEIEQELQAASPFPIFFMFLGLQGSGERVGFKFLKRLDKLGGRVVDNAGFAEVTDFANLTPQELYERVVFTEYPQWVVAAREAKILA